MITQPQKPVPPAARTLVGTNASSATAPADSGAKTAGSGSGVVSAAPAPGVAVPAHVSDLMAIRAFRDTVTRANGVVIVTNSDATVSAVAMAAVADNIVRNLAVVDQPVHHISKITFLHPSGPRGPVPVKAFVPRKIHAHVHMVPISHCSRFDPLVPEGVHILVNQLKPRECVFAQVEYKDLTREAAVLALAELNAKVEELGALLVIFVFHTRKRDVGWLQDHCGVFVEVGECEPGPGAQAALALTNVSVSYWHPRGIGRVMVEADCEPDGGWTYRTEPFVAERAIIRLAWYMSNKNASLRDIAKVVGLSASNISRGFALLSIPPKNTVGVAPPKGWLNRRAADYNLELVWPRKSPDKDAIASGVDVPAKGPASPESDTVDSVGKQTLAPARVHPASPNVKP